MMKRTLALILCIVMCLGTVATFASCAKKDEEYRGEQVIMYLPTNMYDLDPANAYYNEATKQVVSLMFETLFTLDDKGKIKNALAEDYKIIKDDNKMEITLAETFWSDNTSITADDVVFAWKRILDVSASYEAAALLYDIRNARAVKEGEASIDDLGLYADNKIVTIEFEEGVDYDQFLMNLTSLALAPLSETAVTTDAAKAEDWAKKPATIVCSGPFKLGRINFVKDEDVQYTDNNFSVETTVDADVPGENPEKVWGINKGSKDFDSQKISSFIIERNPYYYRNTTKKKTDIDSKVTPYRILVDCSLSPEQIKAAYEAGQILYMGEIPMEIRNDYKDSKDLTVKDALSTHTYYLNHNALIEKKGSETGEALFANKAVRQALSMAIDREAIAEMLVFAEAASGIVPTGIFSSGTVKETFREACSNNYEYLTKNMDKARSLLSGAGITPSDYTFSITVAAYDEDHLAIAEFVVAAWNELGFNVTIKERGTIVNNDYNHSTENIPQDICDDLYVKDLKEGKFEVIALDTVATAATPYAVLAPYAKAFSGQGMVMPSFIGDGTDSDEFTYELTPHISGYDSEQYNAKIEEVFSEKKIANRNSGLMEAEAILMDDMAVIPIVFNKYATLKQKNLDLNDKTLWWTKNTNYYTTTNFEKMEVKKYDEYLATCEAHLAENFDVYKENKFSYFYTFNRLPYDDGTEDDFKHQSSNYSYLFPNIES